MCSPTPEAGGLRMPADSAGDPGVSVSLPVQRAAGIVAGRDMSEAASSRDWATALCSRWGQAVSASKRPRGVR
jgi:hypothetical protein